MKLLSATDRRNLTRLFLKMDRLNAKVQAFSWAMYEHERELTEKRPRYDTERYRYLRNAINDKRRRLAKAEAGYQEIKNTILDVYGVLTA